MTQDSYGTGSPQREAKNTAPVFIALCARAAMVGGLRLLPRAMALRGGGGGQMHGLVALDEADQVLRPAVLWNDGRTVREVDYLNETIGRDTLSRYTANIAFAGFTAPKLLLDVAHRRWSREMCAICGVAEAQLPKLFESWESVGTLLPDAAKALGLPADVTVCAGTGDNAAASCNRWWQEEILGATGFQAEQAKITPDRLGKNHVYFLPYLIEIHPVFLQKFASTSGKIPRQSAIPRL